MTRYGFLRSRRWAGMAALAVVVSLVCVLLGTWQWSRHEDRSAANDLVDSNYDRSPAPLGELVDDAVPAGLVWRAVTVEGTYVGEQVLVRNRPVDGVAASRVLALLRTAGDGTLVVVDRGWVPLEGGSVPDYPGGEVSLVARLRQAEAVDSRTAPAGQVYRIEPDAVAQAAGGVDGTFLDGYLLAVTEDGAPAEGLQPFPRPQTTPGSHLSYAFQWWVFAVGALVGFGVLARREAAEGAAPAEDRPARRRTDADEEDALIDAQLR